jgi:hypothetical protein
MRRAGGGRHGGDARGSAAAGPARGGGRGQRPVPGLAALLAAGLLAAGCSAGQVQASGAGGRGTSGGPAAARGTVSGRLVMEGGPLGPGAKQPGSRPIPGTIQFARAGHPLVTAHAGRKGTFSARLSAGTYRVRASSPRITVGSGRIRDSLCSHPASVTVTAGHATRITLTCVVP